MSPDGESERRPSQCGELGGDCHQTIANDDLSVGPNRIFLGDLAFRPHRFKSLKDNGIPRCQVGLPYMYKLAP